MLPGWLYIVSVFLHLLAAAVWVGGMLFLGLVVVPALRGISERTSVLERVGALFERVGIGALLLALLTGLLNLWFRGVHNVEQLWATPTGRMGLLKIGLLLVVAALSLWHNRVLGVRAIRLLREAPQSPEAQRLRRLSSWIGRAMLAVSLLLVFLGVVLARGMSLW